jgi:poly(3-hydroxybutyrate) depolymerase
MESNNLTFAQMKRNAFKLLRKRKYSEGTSLLQDAVNRFPDKFPGVAFQLALYYVMAGNFDKALEVLELGQQKKVPFPIWPGAMPMAKLENDERYAKIIETNRQIQAELSAAAKPDVSVKTPVNYSEGNTYPLFIVLHHWNSNAESFSKFWRSKKAGKEYIVAFIQSSQVVAPGMFGWTDYGKGREDIKTIYEDILRRYPVDSQPVVIGGFSQGGMLSIDAAVNNIVPAAGFVALQPGGDPPRDFTVENVQKAAERGVRGTIITSTNDFSFKTQKEMDSLFREAKLDLRFVVKRAFGHGMILGVPRQINKALAHIEEGLGK